MASVVAIACAGAVALVAAEALLALLTLLLVARLAATSTTGTVARIVHGGAGTASLLERGARDGLVVMVRLETGCGVRSALGAAATVLAHAASTS